MTGKLADMVRGRERERDRQRDGFIRRTTCRQNDYCYTSCMPRLSEGPKFATNRLWPSKLGDDRARARRLSGLAPFTSCSDQAESLLGCLGAQQLCLEERQPCCNLFLEMFAPITMRRRRRQNRLGRPKWILGGSRRVRVRALPRRSASAVSSLT